MAILFNRYDPVKALDEITFMDPALETGVESYESRVLLYATQIQNDGELVARFSWTSIESQETVLDFVARTMLLKAWASGQSVHQPAFVGYLRDKVIAVTDVTIRSNPVRGGFILGFGTVSGGDATMNWHQTVTSELRNPRRSLSPQQVICNATRVSISLALRSFCTIVQPFYLPC